MKHHIKITITTKEKIAKVLHEIELTCNELVERDEDLNIEHEKTSKPRKKVRRSILKVGTVLKRTKRLL